METQLPCLLIPPDPCKSNIDFFEDLIAEPCPLPTHGIALCTPHRAICNAQEGGGFWMESDLPQRRNR